MRVAPIGALRKLPVPKLPAWGDYGSTELVPVATRLRLNRAGKFPGEAQRNPGQPINLKENGPRISLRSIRATECRSPRREHPEVNPELPGDARPQSCHISRMNPEFGPGLRRLHPLAVLPVEVPVLRLQQPCAPQPRSTRNASCARSRRDRRHGGAGSGPHGLLHFLRRRHAVADAAGDASRAILDAIARHWPVAPMPK